ncbi:MAG TPA: PEP-CTERM sorting domain-containing protein [Phycisphaerae bacterium]|nr:PEP-CTERM sorting domain-containing protein [Phycisphaerae bacterium]
MSMRACLSVVAPAVVMAFFAGTARAAMSASAQIALTSTVGADNHYTITVDNTGTTNIGTFWFAWTPPGAPIEYDFLPTAPSAASEPTGWVGLISPGFPGTSIEYYNVSGSAISPGQMGTFQFTTTDTPATLQGSVFGFPITTSFIYEGFPEVGAFAQVNPTFVAAPEPASVGVLGVVGVVGVVGVGLLRRRRVAPGQRPAAGF